MRFRAVSAVILATLGAASAAVAAGWGAPQTLSKPREIPQGLAIGYDANGAALAAWTWSGANRDGSLAHTSMASRPASRARFGPERELPAGLVAGPLPYGDGRVLIATQSDRIDSRTGARVASTLRVRFGDLRGRFGTPHVIAQSPAPIYSPQLAVNSRGLALLVWTTSRDQSRGAVYASVRPPGGGFGRAVRIWGRFAGPRAAVGPSGDMLVAFNSGGVHASFKRRSERAFGPVERVRSEPGAAPRAIVLADGSAWLGWFAQTLSSAGTYGMSYIEVARRPAGARRFGRALLLARGREAGGGRFGRTVSFAAGPRGTAGMAWTSLRSTQGTDVGVATVRVALIDAAGRFTVHDLAQSSTAGPRADVSLTFASNGVVTVVWTTIDVRSGARAYVSERPARGAWSSPALVAERPSFSGLVASHGPRGGPLTVLFGAGRSGARLETVQAITRGPG